MSQTYAADFTVNTTFGSSPDKFNANYEALRSQFSGTAFPSSPTPVAGQPCFRTDRLDARGNPKEYIYTGNTSLGETGWVERGENSPMGGELINSRGTKSSLDQRLDVALNEDGTLKASTTLNPSQWYLPSLTFTYVSALVFRVNGDQRDIYKANRRLKINLGSSVIYAEVASSAYTTYTDVTIQNASGSIDATLVSVEHSLFLPVAGDTEGGKSALSLSMLAGSTIDVAITETFDLSGLPVNIVHALFPWSSPGKVADPSTLPSSSGLGSSWSPNGEFLAVAHYTTPFITIYQRTETTFIKLSNPSILPTGTAHSISWSLNGTFLAVAHETTPFITIYQRSGTTFTKLSNPATLPTEGCYGTAWSPNGEFLVVAHSITPFITIYQCSGTTFTKLSNPATLPSASSYGTAWSPNGKFLAVAHDTTPFITIYQRSGTTFTKLSNPATLPTGSGYSTSWSPNGEFLAVAHDTTPFITIYQRSGTTFTKLSNPATLPSLTGYGTSWSPNGDFLAVAHNITPFASIYQKVGTTFNKISNPSTLPAACGMSVSWSPNGEFLSVGHDTTPFITIYQTASDMPTSGYMRIIGQKRAGT